MINPQLLEYVRAQRSAGLSREAIIKALAQGGWTERDVTEAFMAIDGVQTPPPPPPPPPPGPVAPRVITPPIQPPASAVQPAPIARPVPAMSEISTAGMPKHSHWLLYTFLVILLLVCIGLGALVYMRPALVMDLLGLGTTPAQEEVQSPSEQAPVRIAPIETSSSTPLMGDTSTTSSATSTASSTPAQ